MTPQTKREPLTSAICQKIIIESTPRPRDFPDGGDPSAIQLFDLGVVDPITSALFVQAVKGHMPAGWQIREQDVTSAPNTSIQAARIALQTHAF